MNKVTIRFSCALILVASISMHSMSIQIPTTFALTTALDKITVSNIARTATCAAGVGLLFLAARDWAHAAKPFPADVNPIPTEAERKIVKEGYMKSALRYFIGGCVFTAAALIHTYRNEIINGAKDLLINHLKFLKR